MKIIQTIKRIATAPLLAITIIGATAPVVSAADCTNGGTDISITSGKDCAQGTGTQSSLFGTGSLFETVTNVLLFLIGAVSVIMLIIGGIRYTISGGDSSQITAAKNTILYAVIGIIVALLAYAIVNFVVSSFIAS